MRGIFRWPSGSPHKRPVMNVIHEMTSWSVKKCNQTQQRFDRYQPFNSSADSDYSKEKNRSGASWYSNRSWLCPALLFLHQHASGYRQSFVSLVFCIQCFFFSSKPKQRFPTEHENFADKCDGLFTWRCLDIMYNLHHITLSSQYVNVIVTQYCTACVYGLMGNKVQLKPIFHFWIMTKPDVTTGTDWIGLSGRNWLFGPCYIHSSMPMFRLCQRYKTMHVFVFHCVHLFY